MEDIEIHGEAGIGVRKLKIFLGGFTESFYQDPTTIGTIKKYLVAYEKCNGQTNERTPSIIKID